MQLRSKRPVWFLFKLFELLLSFICCLVHWHCKQHNGVPHIFVLCGTYGGSVIVGFLSILCSLYAEKPKMRYEAAHAAVLGSFHLITVFAHMHMNTLREFQGPNWVGFYNCSRDNAMMAMFAAAIYFLHCNFAIDLMISHAANVKKHPDRSKRPLKLYFISPGVEEYVSRYGWFQHLANRTNFAQPSEHSNRTRNVSYDSESESEDGQGVSITKGGTEGYRNAFHKSSVLKERKT